MKLLLHNEAFQWIEAVIQICDIDVLAQNTTITDSDSIRRNKVNMPADVDIVSYANSRAMESFVLAGDNLHVTMRLHEAPAAKLDISSSRQVVRPLDNRIFTQRPKSRGSLKQDEALDWSQKCSDVTQAIVSWRSCRNKYRLRGPMPTMPSSRHPPED